MSKVIVTAAADGFKFLDTNAKAFKVKAGDTAVVLSGTYAQSLVDSGFAEWLEPDAVSVIEPEAGNTAVADADILAALVAVDGIGPKTAEKLLAAGIRSVADLIAADATALAGTLDVTESKVTGWQNAAKVTG